MSQSLFVKLHRGICKPSVDNYFLDLDMNVNVLLDTGLKELFPQMIVYTELRWVVFGCCGVVFKQILKFVCTKIVINSFRSLYTVITFLKITVKI